MSAAPGPVRLEHVALYCADLEGMRAFFVRYLQAECGELYHNERTDFRSYFLQFSGGARLELMHKPGLASAPMADRLGYIHLAFSLGSQAAVDELTAQLRQAGYAVVSGPRTTGDGYYESCVEGPEGNLLELTV